MDALSNLGNTFASLFTLQGLHLFEQFNLLALELRLGQYTVLTQFVQLPQ